MEEESGLEFRGAQVVIELAGASAIELIGRLCLDHHGFVDDHVETLAGEVEPFVVDEDWDFSSYAMRAQGTVDVERLHVDAFEKAEAEGVVDFEERADDREGEDVIDRLAVGNVDMLGSSHSTISVRRLRTRQPNSCDSWQTVSAGLSGVLESCVLEKRVEQDLKD